MTRRGGITAGEPAFRARRMGLRTGFVAVLLPLSIACGGHGMAPAGTTWDRPVPADEPRAELRLALDLPPASDCEERFDLELYRHTAVDLVAWEPGSGCRGRRATVRYLPRRASREAVLERVRTLAVPGSVRERGGP